MSLIFAGAGFRQVVLSIVKNRGYSIPGFLIFSSIFLFLPAGFRDIQDFCPGDIVFGLI